MYRAYLVPDATQYNNRSAMYQAKLLLWDPRSESDAYAVIGPKLKGELNKAESFEFTVLPANIRYEQIYKKLSVVIIYDDDEWIFEGVVSDCPKDFYKQMKVTCSGPLSYLCDSIQAPDEKNSVSIPTASETRYVRVPKQWYNNANPHSDGWHERSADVDSDGNYTYTLSGDRTPNQNKTYYYVSSGDNQNYSGSTITKKAATKETISAHLERLLEVHNSQVDAFKDIYLGRCVGDSTQHEFKSSNYRETWSAIKSDIIEQYGRYITIKMDDNYTLKLNYLELNDMDSHSTPETSIVFTENMIEMTESDDSDDDIFTVLVPIGKNNRTVSGVSGHDSPEHNDDRIVDPYIKSWGGNKRYVIVSKYAVGKYGYIVKTQTFSDADSDSELWTAAVKYIKNNFDAHTEYEVKGIDKFILGSSNVRIIVGKKCRVKSGWHGVDEKDLYVISAEHDLASPDNDTYKIGIPTSDREATNKTLTGQTTTSSKNSANNYANASSQIASLTDILDKYASEHEGWIDVSYKFRNTVESENGMMLTRFEQDENHINMLAQKIFGVQGSDGVADQDAGFVRIPKPPYRKNGTGVEDYYESPDTANTAYKVPSEHQWLVKNSEGKYVLSTQDTRVTQAQVNDPSVDFYIMRLATRYSDIDVGPGGIKLTVDGNYDRSTYCSSWIQMNEDEILALTGHLWVDEDGHVHVTSGSGMRTDHDADDSVGTKYIQVARTMYKAGVSPKNKKWYERNMNGPGGSWSGLGKSDQETNDDYYKSSTDTEIDRNKYYYYKSGVRETFLAEYGVYDEDNLTAGVVARVVNNPSYHKVDDETKKKAYDDQANPSRGNSKYTNMPWYTENNNGLMGQTLDTSVDLDTDYYYSINNSETWTDLRGDHIVIGPYMTPEQKTDYDKKNETMQERVNRYLGDNKHLNGTICEIASDVVTVHALFAEYINFESADGIEIWSRHAEFWDLTANHFACTQDYGDGDTDAGIAYIDWTVTDILQIGETYFDEDDINNQVGNIVMGFGTPTYSGDDVNIPFYTAAENGDYDDNTNILTFTKPASLGSVTWSSGTNTLTAKTVGGKDFLVGEIKNYVPSGQSEAMAMLNAGYLATETTGYSTVYGIYYKYKTVLNEEKDGKCMLFKTPKNRYPDAVSTIRTRSATGKGDGEDISLGVGGVSTIYAQYKTEANYDASADTYESLTGIKSYAPEIRMRATHNSTTYGNSETVPLGFDDSVDIKTQSKAHDAQDYSDYKTMKVTSPAKPTASGYTAASYKNVSYDDGDEITLDYSGSVKVYARFKLSDASSYTDCTGITVKSKADNSTTISTSDIDLGSVDRYTSEPSADAKLTTLRDEINNAIANGNWVKFKVSVGSLASKTYKMDFT